MKTVVEVGDWEHECCGSAFERNTRVRVGYVIEKDVGQPAWFYESHHELDNGQKGKRPRTRSVEGRVADIVVVHEDDSEQPVVRLPSGRALRGFGDHDDGHLEDFFTHELIENDTSRFRVTIESASLGH